MILDCQGCTHYGTSVTCCSMEYQCPTAQQYLRDEIARAPGSALSDPSAPFVKRDELEVASEYIVAEMEILSFLRKHTRQTGTLAYGLEAADHDRFCTAAVMEQLLALLSSHHILFAEGEGKSGGAAARKITLNMQKLSRPLHIFVVADEEMESFALVTETIGRMARLYPRSAKNKTLRVLAFRQLRDMLTAWRGIEKSGLVV